MVIHLITYLNPIRRDSRKREDKNQITRHRGVSLPTRRYSEPSQDRVAAYSPTFCITAAARRSVVFLTVRQGLCLSHYTFERSVFILLPVDAFRRR